MTKIDNPMCVFLCIAINTFTEKPCSNHVQKVYSMYIKNVHCVRFSSIFNSILSSGTNNEELHYPTTESLREAARPYVNQVS